MKQPEGVNCLDIFFRFCLVYTGGPGELDLDDPLLLYIPSMCYFSPVSNPHLRNKTMSHMYSNYRKPLSSMLEYVNRKLGDIHNTLLDYLKPMSTVTKSNLSSILLQPGNNKETIQKEFKYYEHKIINESEFLEKVLSGSELYGAFYKVVSLLAKFELFDMDRSDIEQSPVLKYIKQHVSGISEQERCLVGEYPQTDARANNRREFENN